MTNQTAASVELHRAATAVLTAWRDAYPGLAMKFGGQDNFTRLVVAMSVLSRHLPKDTDI